MTHTDDSILPEPSQFDPTRFENQTSIPPYCFIPLEGGPRICPGYEFARIETLVTIHHLVTRFTLKCLADNFFKRNPMPVPTKGLPIQIMPTLQFTFQFSKYTQQNWSKRVCSKKMFWYSSFDLDYLALTTYYRMVAVMQSRFT